MDKEKLINYANIAAIILYFTGYSLHIDIIKYLGLGIMVLSNMYNIVHWKENSKLNNYISVVFLVLVGLTFLII